MKRCYKCTDMKKCDHVSFNDMKGGEPLRKEKPMRKSIEGYADSDRERTGIRSLADLKKADMERVADLAKSDAKKLKSGKEIKILQTVDGGHGPEGKHLDSRSYGGHGSMAAALEHNARLVHEAHPDFTAKDHAEAAKITSWPQSSAHRDLASQKPQKIGVYHYNVPKVMKKAETRESALEQIAVAPAPGQSLQKSREGEEQTRALVKRIETLQKSIIKTGNKELLQKCLEAIDTLRKADHDEYLDESDIPEDHPVQPLKHGEKAKDKATCGTCGLSWDDGKVTSMTPTPSARCPFEAFHKQKD